MAIPNQFNGYPSDNRRIYNVGRKAQHCEINPRKYVSI